MVAADALRLSEPLPRAAFREYRQRAIFEAAKWDIQINDHCSLSAQALLIGEDDWRTIAGAAERLAADLLDAERHLLAAMGAGNLPGVDRRSRRHLAAAARAAESDAVPRLIRFDFHPAGGGWVISEANSDVPGGINEASALPRIWPAPPRDFRAPGDPAAAYVAAIRAAVAPGSIALVHATAFSDDWQLMKFLADGLAGAGFRPVACAPDQIDWRDGVASHRGETLAGIVRFFPGDWLIRAGFAGAWFAGPRTPVMNPALGLITQNKAFPILCRSLGIEIPAWDEFLPKVSRISLGALRSPDAVVKPVYGRVGEDIGIPGVTPARKLAKARLLAGLFRRTWVVQARFRPDNIGTAAEPVYPCIGVYTLDDRVIGAYGRLARTPIVDLNALDAPVFVAGAATGGQHGPGRLLQ